MKAASAAVGRRAPDHARPTGRSSGGSSGTTTICGPSPTASARGTIATPSPRATSARAMDGSSVTFATTVGSTPAACSAAVAAMPRAERCESSTSGWPSRSASRRTSRCARACSGGTMTTNGSAPSSSPTRPGGSSSGAAATKAASNPPLASSP